MCHLSHCKTWVEANFKRANILIFVALSYNTHHRCLWKWDYLTNLHSTFPLVNFLFFLQFIRRHYHIGISADGIRFRQLAVFVRFINIGHGIYLLTGKVSPPNRYFFIKSHFTVLIPKNCLINFVVHSFHIIGIGFFMISCLVGGCKIPINSDERAVELCRTHIVSDMYQSLYLSYYYVKSSSLYLTFLSHSLHTS